MGTKYILVLDAFTNGHQAALKFIDRQKWRKEDCEILFCGSHETLIDIFCKGRMRGEPIYAVIPIQNSSTGVIGETLSVLRKLQGDGRIHFDYIDEIDLMVDHCLIGLPGTKTASEARTVTSNHNALKQCGKFLDASGIGEERRIPCHSTALGVKMVSESDPESKMTAIGPKESAEYYGLNIIRENIQDSEYNKTTFAFLENDAFIMPLTVGIIGKNGKIGKYLEELLEKVGCRTIGSDIGTEMSNIEVAAMANVIFFCVPPHVVAEVIASVVPYTCKDQLLIDMTSIKGPAAEAMLKSDAQAAGIHEMKAPGVPPEGQTVFLFPYRLTDRRLKLWIHTVLTHMGSEIKVVDREEHDQYMQPVQAGMQAATYADIFLMKETDIDIGKSLTFASPFYRLNIFRMARLLTQSPIMHAGILMENPFSIKALVARISIWKKMLGMVVAKDYEGFERWAEEAAEHFGKENIEKGDESFRRMLSAYNTAYNQNSIVLEFGKEDDKCGLLLKILGVFARHGVNIDSIVDFSIDAGRKRKQICINPQRSRMSESVWLSLEEIGGWKSPKITILPPNV